MPCHALSTFQVSSARSIRRDNPPAADLEVANMGASSPEADVYAGGKIKYHGVFGYWSLANKTGRH